jgi:Domain of unknown function (DUF5666)/Domain of unknown function (DUF4382)
VKSINIAIALGTVVFVGLLGCGGGGTSNVTGTAGPNPASLNLTMGDAPADSVVSFELTLSSIVLTGPGPSVTVLSKPTEIELTHLAGTVEPLAIMNVPAGTYTGATITISKAEATVINGAGVPVQATVTLPQTSVSVAINLTVSGTASTLNLDLNLAQSLSVNLATNPPTVTVTPVFAASVSTNAAENQQEPENGEIEDVSGPVTATTASGFSISVGQQSLTFNVDSNTKFEGVAGLASLLNGMLVQVDGVTQANGSLRAVKVEVEVEDQDGLEAEGVISSVTGSPATSITLVAQDASSPSGLGPVHGSNITVDVSGAKYVLNNKVDLSGLTFTFDATHIAPAQRVEVDEPTPAANNLVANKVKLLNQGLRGTITGAITPTGNGGSQFTLTVASDSAFAKLTGQTTITVVRQPSTKLMGNANVASGSTVLVRGSLFFDGTGYDLVAVRIAPPE